jgi:hypothetical protein
VRESGESAEGDAHVDAVEPTKAASVLQDPVGMRRLHDGPHFGQARPRLINYLSTTPRATSTRTSARVNSGASR